MAHHHPRWPGQPQATVPFVDRTGPGKAGDKVGKSMHHDKRPERMSNEPHGFACVSCPDELRANR